MAGAPGAEWAKGEGRRARRGGPKGPPVRPVEREPPRRADRRLPAGPRGHGRRPRWTAGGNGHARRGAGAEGAVGVASGTGWRRGLSADGSRGTGTGGRVSGPGGRGSEVGRPPLQGLAAARTAGERRTAGPDLVGRAGAVGTQGLRMADPGGRPPSSALMRRSWSSRRRVLTRAAASKGPMWRSARGAPDHRRGDPRMPAGREGPRPPYRWLQGGLVQDARLLLAGGRRLLGR